MNPKQEIDMISCKTFFESLTIVLAFLDIVVGWYKFGEFYRQTLFLDRNAQVGNVSDVFLDECGNPQLYWKIYLPFEMTATILGVFEIYYLFMEIKTNQEMFDKCFNETFYLVVAIYIFAVFPSSILDIAFRDRCVCHEGFSLEIWQHEVSAFFKGFLGGVSVIFLQIVLHIADIFYETRRLWEFLETYLFCFNFTTYEEVHKPSCRGVHSCFVISTILAICYTVLFIIEIVYIFCVPFG